MKNIIEKFTIPFYQTKLPDWEKKKEQLLETYKTFALPNMVEGDQNTDFKQEACRYAIWIQSILDKDIQVGVKELDYFRHSPVIADTWFQSYDNSHSHGVHNHGIGALSMVCYVEYDPNHHRPTNFVAPFMNFRNSTMLEWEPEDVEEGTLILFPSMLPHYAPPNRSNVRRLILSANLR